MSRCLNKKIQKDYFYSIEYDEFEKSKGHYKQRDQTHEIIFGSRKTYEKWNMVNLTYENHLKAHKNEITKHDLFMSKIRNGMCLKEFPKNIVIEFDLYEE